LLPQELFQLPSEIVDKVKNLNLGTMDEECLVDSSLAEFNYATISNEASMLRLPVLTGSTMRDSVMHESPLLMSLHLLHMPLAKCLV
jgi:hypothetical protein